MSPAHRAMAAWLRGAPSSVRFKTIRYAGVTADDEQEIEAFDGMGAVFFAMFLEDTGELLFNGWAFTGGAA